MPLSSPHPQTVPDTPRATEGRSINQICNLVAVSVAAAFAVPIAEIRAATRCSPRAAFARQSAMYLAHVVFGFTLTDIGHAFGRDRTTAAHACERVENRRDDPELDAMLESLEHACGSFEHQPAPGVREVRR